MIGIAAGDVIVRNNLVHGPYPMDTELKDMWCRGIIVADNAGTNIEITGNTIYSVRNGIIVRYNNTTIVNGNTIFHTKGGIMQYTNNDADAGNRSMASNSWTSAVAGMPDHNEWDIVWNSGGSYTPAGGYDPILILSASNNDAYVLDRRALSQDGLKGNRSHVFVEAGSTHVEAHAAKGNFNEPFSTLLLGLDAVVQGGTVFIAAGTYIETIDPDSISLDGKVLTYLFPGDMKLELPAAILPDYLVEIAILRLPGESPEGFRLLSAIYRFTIADADGVPANFSGSMTITFFYDPAEVDDPNTLDVYWFDGKEWIAQEGVVDTTANTVTIQVDHWSDFALMDTEKAEIEPLPVTGSNIVGLIHLGLLLLLASAFLLGRRVAA